jgi:putative transposase
MAKRYIGMVKNHKLAGAVSDCGWNMFETMVKYKSEWKGKKVAYIGRFEPSSKICSNCGIKNDTLTIDVREWTCENCHTRMIEAGTQQTIFFDLD